LPRCGHLIGDTSYRNTVRWGGGGSARLFLLSAPYAAGAAAVADHRAVVVATAYKHFAVDWAATVVVTAVDRVVRRLYPYAVVDGRSSVHVASLPVAIVASPAIVPSTVA